MRVLIVVRYIPMKYTSNIRRTLAVRCCCCGRLSSSLLCKLVRVCGRSKGASRFPCPGTQLPSGRSFCLDTISLQGDRQRNFILRWQKKQRQKQPRNGAGVYKGGHGGRRPMTYTRVCMCWTQRALFRQDMLRAKGNNKTTSLPQISDNAERAPPANGNLRLSQTCVSRNTHYICVFYHIYIYLFSSTTATSEGRHEGTIDNGSVTFV